MIAGAGGRGFAVAQGPAGNACCVAQGQDCTAAGCGGGAGALTYVGTGQGDYMQETTYRYVGYGGDFARGRRDFTCIITSCCLASLLLIPLLLYLLAGVPVGTTPPPYNCNTGEYLGAWSQAQRDYCCTNAGLACPTQPVTQAPTPPPTPPPTVTQRQILPGVPAPRPPVQPIAPVPPVNLPPADPYNCAVGVYDSWQQPKKTWCCTHHNICSAQTQAPAPADPYNCADGFSNWQAGWSAGKKQWCCRVHGKGCPGSGGGCAPNTPAPAPYDCNAGFANWVAGWSQPKKDWCCRNGGKGCGAPNNGGCA